jgi:NAD-dependent dihydropyrimidine dehydrogenase PreA subunit
VREYVGNTGHSGTGAYLHDQNPALAYVGPIEMALDRRARTWSVTPHIAAPVVDRARCVGCGQCGNRCHAVNVSAHGKLARRAVAVTP